MRHQLTANIFNIHIQFSTGKKMKIREWQFLTNVMAKDYGKFHNIFFRSFAFCCECHLNSRLFIVSFRLWNIKYTLHNQVSGCFNVLSQYSAVL